MRNLKSLSLVALATLITIGAPAAYGADQFISMEPVVLLAFTIQLEARFAVWSTNA